MAFKKSVICEKEFELEDHNNKGYSLAEYDFYGHITADALERNIANHMLSLRKNLTKEVFEIVRTYHHNKEKDVVFSGTFDEALEFAQDEKESIWETKELFYACVHGYPLLSSACPKRLLA